MRKRRWIAAAAITAVGALALSGCSGGSGAGAEKTFDPNEKITLNLTWWGNDDRAAKYGEMVDAFEDKYPNITVDTSFMDYPAYWEKRKTEAAGGGLPDVMQFDWTYVSEFGQNGLLAPLDDFYGDEIDVSSIDENVLSAGEVDGKHVAIPVGTNSWALFQNDRLLGELGVDAYPGGGTWDDYNAYLAEVKKAGDGKVWGGTDYTGRIQFFELWLRQQGKSLFDEDNKPAFTKDDLAEFLNMGEKIRSEGLVVPQKKVEEVKPKSGFGSLLATSEASWDNFGAGYMADSGEKSLSLVAPPALPGAEKDLYLKPAMLIAIGAKTKHPEAAAMLTDFLTTTEKSGEVFGASRGIPVTKAASATLQGADADVVKYEESIAGRIGPAPVPPVGYGSLEQKFLDLGNSIGLGAISVDDFVDQFFNEMDVILN
ncbi:extracellular solute-binding protein [Cryobacterium tepidiphilum]|uniref:Extracellular solute-binding protein n=1 Tax=Cryobacterium tepidiphilum TaxID=2486026 RepID=A0A3M8LQH3_9MICO|nr:extracellular solute-binding protein [Cryobacterium tepidiphilum]